MHLRHVVPPAPLAALAASVLAVLAALTAPAAAQSEFIYAFALDGHVSANGYPLDKLKSGGTSPEDETWRDLAVRGPDRWLLRGDGTISLNGEKIEDLGGDEDWRALVVDDNGDFFALRRDGRVAGAEGEVHDYPDGPFDFLDMVADGTTLYVLKTNGAIFRVPEPDPIIKFNGPPGEVSGSTGDGEATDTLWVRLLRNPADGRLWALRRDGTLMSAAIPPTPPATPDPGQQEASLPYNDNDDEIDPGDLYNDFTFDVAGAWSAIRADGKLFDAAHPGPPLIDYPGGAGSSASQTYQSVIAAEAGLLVLRADGKVFRGEETDALIDLPDVGYVRFALGAELPDLVNVKNQKPFASKATITAPEGADVELAVIAVDRDLPADELLVSVVPETLPAGASFDEVARVLSWPDAGPPGTYKVKVTVDDGIAKPVTAVQTLTIKKPDENASKNIKPSIEQVSGVVALAALPFALPVASFDLDGDPVELTLNDNGKLPETVTFDGADDTLHWDDPLVSDTGTRSFKINGTDGTAQVSRTIKVKVQTSLLAF
jgi:hypothetical protein